jgi:hypothetical protein
MSASPYKNLKTHYLPDELAALSAAFDIVCDAARLHQASQMIRDLVASSVLDMASTGERDPLKLACNVMEKLGLRVLHAA